MLVTLHLGCQAVHKLTNDYGIHEKAKLVALGCHAATP